MAKIAGIDLKTIAIIGVIGFGAYVVWQWMQGQQGAAMPSYAGGGGGGGAPEWYIGTIPVNVPTDQIRDAGTTAITDFATKYGGLLPITTAGAYPYSTALESLVRQIPAGVPVYGYSSVGGQMVFTPGTAGWVTEAARQVSGTPGYPAPVGRTAGLVGTGAVGGGGLFLGTSATTGRLTFGTPIGSAVGGGYIVK